MSRVLLVSLAMHRLRPTAAFCETSCERPTAAAVYRLSAECFEAPSPQLCPGLCVLAADCATRLSFHAHSSQACHWLEMRTMVFWTLRLCIPLLLSWDFGVRPCMHTATSFLDLRISSTFSLCGTYSGTSTPTLLAVLSQLFCHTGLLREHLPAVGYALVSWVLGSQSLAVC